MSNLKIKTEYLPERCEICHQTDCFDAEQNYCTRCDQIHLIYTQTKQQLAQSPTVREFIYQNFKSPSNFFHFFVEWGHVIILSFFFAFLSFVSVWGVSSSTLLIEESSYFIGRSLIGLLLFCLAVSFPITYYFENHHVQTRVIGKKLIELFLGIFAGYLPSIAIGLLLSSNPVIFYASFGLGFIGGLIGLCFGNKIIEWLNNLLQSLRKFNFRNV